MIMDKTIKRALINSISTVLYIVLVVSLILTMGSFLPEPEDMFIVPIAMLLLFVCSAAITSFLVFGKPVMMYIDGQKKEAVSLLAYTLGIMVVITIILFVALILYLGFFT